MNEFEYVACYAEDGKPVWTVLASDSYENALKEVQKLTTGIFRLCLVVKRGKFVVEEPKKNAPYSLSSIGSQWIS